MLSRFLSSLVTFGTVGLFLTVFVSMVYIRLLIPDLPDYEVLSRYEPPVTTRLHASDGSLMAEYAHERRLYIPIHEIPKRVREAFLSAEDKNFYTHGGINYFSTAKAAFDAIYNFALSRRGRVRGASTITQQVAKNFLLTSDRTLDRKIKEALLAHRIEQTYTKDEILELYLNEIFFGFSSYGVAGAALTYFDKSLDQLDLHEIAYLAALPKGPNNYHPHRYRRDAINRRNWVLDRMHINGYISLIEARSAQIQPLGIKRREPENYVAASQYFVEEVRRELLSRYGEDVLYEGGLSVRTTLSPSLQANARRSLLNGLISYDRQRGYRVSDLRVDLSLDWGVQLAAMDIITDVPEWTLAAVLSSNSREVIVGLRPAPGPDGRVGESRDQVSLSASDMRWALKILSTDGFTRQANSIDRVLKPGDVVYVSREDAFNHSADSSDDSVRYVLQQVPEVSGALLAMNPHTGRVLSMVGGFSFSRSQFNRATQAFRQPGSSFKPFVYAAALDNGYTPSSVILDGPIQIDQGRNLGIWEPKNYSSDYAGPQTLRRGIESSRNLMTVRLAADMGMPLVAQYAKSFGIYDYDIFGLAASLGSHETTLLRMVSAYSVLANGGKHIDPSLIDRIQDRYGKTVYRHEQRICLNCNTSLWESQPEPPLIDTRDQVLDPQTAYQITTMLEGVVQRGTGTKVKVLGVPVAGKTGTTNDERDAWFIGYTPDLAVGVFMGYDQPRSMGHGSTGGGVAAPIFADFMQQALANEGVIDFRLPEGIRFYPIESQTGLQARAGDPGVIMEAFKPGTRPPDKSAIIDLDDSIIRGELITTPEADAAVLHGEGGLY